MSAREPLFAVVGPTASGKSALAMALAEAMGGEIVSVDSAQVFRGLDIGTAKPSAEEQRRVRHHLIDIIAPNEQWSAADYSRAADAAIADIRARGRTPILCGGTGLWLRALVHGIFEAPAIDPEVRSAVREAIERLGAPVLHAELASVDPEAAARIQPTDPQRIGRALEVYRQCGVPISRLQAEHGFREVRYSLVATGLHWPRERLAERIAERTQSMYAGGLVEEVRGALEGGLAPDAPGLSIIGYRDAVRHVLGQMDLEEAIRATETATRQYAKRQRNWFRGQSGIEWIEPGLETGDVLARLRARSLAV